MERLIGSIRREVLDHVIVLHERHLKRLLTCYFAYDHTCDGFLLGKRYLIHDRDTKFLHGFDRMLRVSGVEPVVLPPRSPNLNAHGERFVRSLKE